MTDDSRPKRRRRRRRRPGDGDAGTAKTADTSRPRGRGGERSGDGKRRGGRRRGGGEGSKEASSKRSPSGDERGKRKPRDRGAHKQAPTEKKPAAEPVLDRKDLARFSVGEDESFVPDNDDDEGSPAVVLKSDLPEEASNDPDPSTAAEGDGFQNYSVHDIVGIRFASAGKVYLYDSGRQRYQRGDRVMVDSDHGPRAGIVAFDTQRRSHSRKQLKRVLRRASDEDREKEAASRKQSQAALHTAKEIARRHRLPIKVFRCEISSRGNRAVIHFSSEGKVDARALVRDLAKELGCRVDSRQTGVRDEAKLVGGIGSCGQELCCTTWLPSFVPVSIKNAKDQGLVLNPTKVSGQCGRLKCCLVYEHATYAEMRKGLPKLGKRVVTDDGEGRVVEVDVLRRRVRVSLVDGPVKVYAGDEVEPLFPSQKPKPAKQ